jgi:hypothetical protein
MRTVVLAEKPSLAQAILESIVANNPDPNGEWYGAAAPPYCVLGRSFRFPKGIAYNEFPAIREPMYHGIGEEGSGLGFIRQGGVTAKGPFGWRKIIDGTVTLQRDFPEGYDRFDYVSVLKGADRIQLCFDSEGTSQHGSLKVYEYVRSLNKTAVVTWHTITDIRDAGLSKALATSVDVADVLAAAKSSEIKRFFDYNFLNNRNVILRRTFDHIGRPSDANLPSKLGIPLLYWLSDLPDGTVDRKSDLQEALRRWPGTGRYAGKAAKIDSYQHQFSNIASESAIIWDLVHGGLATETREAVAITDAGYRFLAALHPDCRDLDLPFRIREWQSQDIAVAKPKIAQYLNTWFGKQKRFLEKLGR